LFEKAVLQYKEKYPDQDDKKHVSVPDVIRRYLFMAARLAAHDADPRGQNSAASDKAADARVAAELKHLDGPDGLLTKAWRFSWLKDPFEK
jgi:hypothetical protein